MQGAFRASLGVKLWYTDGGVSGSRAVYRRGAISLSTAKAGGVALVEQLPPPLCAKLERGLGLLREASERGLLMAELKGGRAVDLRILRGGTEYSWVVNELHCAGLLGETEAVCETVGMVSVDRKDKQLSLIFDRRRPSSHFAPPESLELARRPRGSPHWSSPIPVR